MRALNISENLRMASRGITIRSAIIWVALSSIGPLGFMAIRRGGRWSIHSALSTSVESIAVSIMLGLIFFFGPALFFSSKTILAGQSNLEGVQPERMFLWSFLVFVITTSLFMMVFNIMSFVWFLQFTDVAQQGALHPGAILAAFGAAILISIILCAIASSIAVAFDNWKSTMLMGVGLSLSLSTVSDFTVLNAVYPVTVFLSPHQLYRSIFFILSGIGGSWQAQFNAPVGIDSFLPPMILFVGLAILSLHFSIRMLPFNLEKQVLEEENRSLGSSDVDGQKSESLIRLRAKMTARRKTVAVPLILLIAFIPLLGFAYTQQRIAEYYYVVYESPSGGELVEIGQWLSGSFMGMDVPDYVSPLVGCEGEIENWVGGPGDIRFNFQHREMTLMEFQQMNATEKEDLFGSGWTRSYERTGTFDSGEEGPIHDVEYVWALRFLDINGETEGTFSISFRVIVRGY
jgi:hypothetical protein